MSIVIPQVIVGRPEEGQRALADYYGTLKPLEEIPHRPTTAEQQRTERERKRRERRDRRELEVIAAAGEQLADDVGMVRSLDCPYPQPETPAEGVAWWKASVLPNLRAYELARPKLNAFEALRALGPLDSAEAKAMYETWLDVKELTRVLERCGFTPAASDSATE